MPKRIDHIAIIVRNIEQALLFYRDTLGITPSAIKEVPTEQVRIAFLPMGGPDGSEIELIEPTTKLRFLRALAHSDYRRIGQREFRVEGQTLLMTWDLRWNTLLETKQQEIVHNVGRAWQVVGGEDTRFLIEGEDNTVASYKKGEVHLSSP